VFLIIPIYFQLGSHHFTYSRGTFSFRAFLLIVAIHHTYAVIINSQPSAIVFVQVVSYFLDEKSCILTM
jgi:hypothetical protein